METSPLVDITGSNLFWTDMLAKVTMLFDQRVCTLRWQPHNTVSFDSQGRLLFLAGFSNLTGKIDVFDRRTFNKICTIDAPEASYCAWSPDGGFLLTAALSPRLRIDNGVKVWHASGPVVHIQVIEELYQASWRPTPVDKHPPLDRPLHPNPLRASSLLRSLPSPWLPAYSCLSPPWRTWTGYAGTFQVRRRGWDTMGTHRKWHDEWECKPPGSILTNGIFQNGHGQAG